MPYRDEYTDFSFNEMHSSQFNVWVTNGRDIPMALTPNFSNTYANASFANGRVLTALNTTHTTIAVKCVAANITLQDWRAIQMWLSPNVVGKLTFDFNDHTYYNAKIASQVNGTGFVIGRFDRLVGDLYFVEFTVNFETVGDYAALSNVNMLKFTEGYSDKNPKEGVCSNKYYMPMFLTTRFESSIMANEGTQVKHYINKLTNVLNKTIYVDGAALANASTGSAALVFEPDIYNLAVEGNKVTQLNLMPSLSVQVEDGDNSVKQVVVRGTINTSFVEERENKLARNYLYPQTAVANSDKTTKYIMGEGSQSDAYNESLGYTFFAMNVLMFPLIENLFYYYDIEPGNEVAVMNTGSYESWPTLYCDSGTSDIISISKDNEVVYNYVFNFDNALVSFDGRYGLVTQNGQLAEGVTLTTKAGAITLVSSAENNGVLEIPSGKPEIVRAHISNVYENLVGIVSDDDEEDLKNVNVKLKENMVAIEFDAIDALKYSRDGRYAIHFFTGVDKESLYNIGEYSAYSMNEEVGATLKESESTNGKYYGLIQNSILTVNGMIVEKDNKHYFIFDRNEAVVDETVLTGLAELVDAKCYISLCDCTMLEISCGGGGYIAMQTRDVI